VLDEIVAKLYPDAHPVAARETLRECIEDPSLFTDPADAPRVAAELRAIGDRQMKHAEELRAYMAKRKARGAR
jgi:hypothetical protein